MNAMKKQILAFCLVFLLYMLPFASGYAENAGDVFLPEDAFRSDYVFLWDQLYENYPFFPCLESKGLNIRKLQADYEDAVTSHCRDLPSFLNLLSDLFQRMDHFAHLSVVTPSMYQECHDYALENAFGPVHTAMLLDPQTESVYQSLQTPSNESTHSFQEPEVRYDEEASTLVFRIAAFKHAFLERDRSLVSDALKQYPDVKHVVFDITGNGGGSDYYWINNIVTPFGGSFWYDSILYFKDTPLTRQYHLMDDAVSVDMLRAAYPIPDAADHLGFTNACVSRICYPSERLDPEKTIDTIQRWVLIDGGVYSAADSFAAFCKETGWAKLVGTQTMGDGGNAAPLFIRLPHTKLLVQFSCAATFNSDGSLNTEAGTLPDVIPKPRESSLEACMRLIHAALRRGQTP